MLTHYRQFAGDNAVILEFSAHVSSLSVKGVDIIQFNAAGQITDFEVMVSLANRLQAHRRLKVFTIRCGGIFIAAEDVSEMPNAPL